MGRLWLNSSAVSGCSPGRCPTHGYPHGRLALTLRAAGPLGDDTKPSDPRQRPRETGRAATAVSFYSLLFRASLRCSLEAFVADLDHRLCVLCPFPSAYLKPRIQDAEFQRPGRVLITNRIPN